MPFKLKIHSYKADHARLVVNDQDALPLSLTCSG